MIAIAAGIFILIFQNAGTLPITTAQAATIQAPEPQAMHSPLDVNIAQIGGEDADVFYGALGVRVKSY